MTANRGRRKTLRQIVERAVVRGLATTEDLEDRPVHRFRKGEINGWKADALASYVVPGVMRALKRAAPEWEDISTAPENVEVLIAVFRDDFEDPIIQNSILLDGEERGMYWSDWHGVPAPTHWMHFTRPATEPPPSLPEGEQGT